MLFNIRSPFTNPNNEKKELINTSELVDSLSGWSHYIIWSFIFICIAGILIFASRAVYGIVTKNGEMQKRSIYLCMTFFVLLIFIRLGVPFIYAVVEYGVNRFLHDLVYFSAGTLLYVAVGVGAMGVCYLSLHKLINHPGIRRKSIHYFIAAAILVFLSFFVPTMFLQV